MIKLKSSVRVPRVVIILAAVANAAQELRLNVYVTSGNDTKHMLGSKHYKDEALDFRTKNIINDRMKEVWRDKIKERLGEDYDVILEGLGTPNEHLHVECNFKER